MLRNENFFQKVILNETPNYFKVKSYEHKWEYLITKKNTLFDAIVTLLFEKENMFYYLTQRSSTKTLLETKEYVKKLLQQGNLNQEISSVYNVIGWSKEKLNINSTIFQGDLAEYLMSIIIDLLGISKTLISKISLKTSSKMPVYGNDNVYYDLDNNTLYFGESKFYEDLERGLNESIQSLKKHDDISEISFIKNQTNSFIANNGEELYILQEKFETISVKDISKGTICFIVEDQKYIKSDIEMVLKNFVKKNENDLKSMKTIIIILPILSKSEFLEYFYYRLIDLLEELNNE